MKLMWLLWRSGFMVSHKTNSTANTFGPCGNRPWKSLRVGLLLPLPIPTPCDVHQYEACGPCRRPVYRHICMIASRIVLRRLACQMASVVKLWLTRFAIHIFWCPSVVVGVLKELNFMRQVPLLFKPVCGFCTWGLGELAVGILLALQLRSLGPTFAIAGPMPLLLHK